MKLVRRIAFAAASLLLLSAAASAPTPWRATVSELAQKTLKNPAWGYSHSQRNYALAAKLARQDGVKLDDDVMFAAAYLHDIAAFPGYAKEGVDHADRAAELVGPILTDAGFPAAKIDAVKAAITTHMYFRDPKAAEARYLHDADALDWLGAIGIARVTALVDPNGGKPAGPDVVKMLEENIAEVPARVVTPAGRKLMPARRDFLARYLSDLKAQTDGYATL